MGNCQAVDNASLILQTQNGRAERFYSPVSAAEIMKLHPGYSVALLLTTTLYSPPTSTSSDDNHQNHQPPNHQQPLRVTRIKLLRPADNLLLGHAYRLLTNQEVMKGLKAKRNGKSKSFQPPADESAGKSGAKANCEASYPPRKSDKDGAAAPAKSKPPSSSMRSKQKPKGWHPSLNSISEATS